MVITTTSFVRYKDESCEVFILNVFGVYSDGDKCRILCFFIVAIPKLLELILGDCGTVYIVNFFKSNILSCHEFITISKTKIMYLNLVFY